MFFIVFVTVHNLDSLSYIEVIVGRYRLVEMVAFCVGKLQHIYATASQIVVNGKLGHTPQARYHLAVLMEVYATMPEGVTHLAGPLAQDTFLVGEALSIIAPTSLEAVFKLSR